MPAATSPTKLPESTARTFDFSPVTPLLSWPLASIMSARDAHRAGSFELSTTLASAFRTDDAIYAALSQRLSPIAGLPRAVSGGNARVRAEVEGMAQRSTAAAQDGASLCPPIPFPDADLLEQTLLCGFCVAQMVWTPSDDGRRLNFALDPWPVSRLRWSAYDRTMTAQTMTGLVPVVHGDGTWIVVQQRAIDPWDAGALIPLASAWGSRAYGWRDLAQICSSLSMSKLIATLPEGMAADDAEGAAFLAAVKGLYRPQSGALVPFGSKVEALSLGDGGAGWQMIRELIKGRDQSISRILLGSDGTTQATGGDYRKSTYLWGVRQDLVEASTHWLSDAYAVALRVWSERNFGRDMGLSISWLMPDPDEDARIEAFGDHVEAYCTALDSLSRRHVVTQAEADALADAFRVPRMPLASAPAPADGTTASPAAPAPALVPAP